mmetsp:Transcript_34336/g.102011  ORF Transcript_34336/g.102011 Transcript_34336/m.102011 type:complete len:215 (+) Transcript_34336:47-691(+)
MLGNVLDALNRRVQGAVNAVRGRRRSTSVKPDQAEDFSSVLATNLDQDLIQFQPLPPARGAPMLVWEPSHPSRIAQEDFRQRCQHYYGSGGSCDPTLARTFEGLQRSSGRSRSLGHPRLVSQPDIPDDGAPRWWNDMKEKVAQRKARDLRGTSSARPRVYSSSSSHQHWAAQTQWARGVTSPPTYAEMIGYQQPTSEAARAARDQECREPTADL